MAARDRFGGFVEPAATPLQRYIQNACDPQNFEPNLALDLEISDLINSKKGNAPREAAIAIVSHVNNRNPNVSLLALTLLDICVKNCGYPFHLQISTKEFLNELVRRFPERPPLRYSRVQSKVLELIEEWRQTICQTSKYKEDLGFIRDMHRLLAYKGYMFPEVKREDAAVLNPSDNLKSAEEMEEEERAAQSAKLQELIRRGTPHDLQEANKLMKVMAGYDNRNKTDYRAKAAEEVGRVQQKAKILEEMLQEQKPGGESINSEGYEDLANALASAQPKIQRMCEEESDDTEAVAKLFEINDSIHRTLERYRLMKKGDYEAASKIPKGTLGTSGAGVSKRGNELSLIDFGPEDAAKSNEPGVAGSSTEGSNSLENDLLGLSLENGNGPPQQSINLGMATSPGPSLLTQPSATSQAPPKPAAAPQSNYDIFNSLSGLQSSQPAPTQVPASNDFFAAQSNLSPAPAAAPPAPAHDPFGALAAPAPRQGSPFQYQQAVRPAPSNSTAPPLSGLGGLQSQPPTSSSSAATLLGGGAPSAAPTAAPVPAPAAAHGPAVDDEWTFASALPDQAHELIVTSSSIHVAFLVSRSPEPENVVLIKSSISNNTTQQISDLTFQLAVMKGLQLKLEPQSGRSLQPHQRAGITQTIRLLGVQPGKGQNVKMRWKASYWLGGEKREEQGELSSLGIA